MKPMSSSFLFFNRPPKKKLAVPARTYEEFLLSQNLDNWPRFPYMQELDISPLIAKLKKDYPLKTLTKYLRDNVPLVTETISNLEKRVQECKIKVDEHVKYTFALESGQSEIDNQGLSVPKEDTFTEPQDIRRNKKLKVAADIIQDTNCKTVENFKFPGFNVQKLTKLPNNLEPARLWDSVLKVQTFKGVNVKVLKKLFFSEASLAILQDCFWWWFLHKFKPDEDEQDHFFDRISDSFVALLLSTPNYIKDPFFQMYPDCLSQTIYVSFCEAFPESYRHFNDEFKEELMDLVFQWIRGFKPRKFAWKEWKIWLLLKQKRDSFTKSSSFIKPLHQSRSSLFNLLDKTQRERKGHIKEGTIGPVRFQIEREVRRKKSQKTTKESHYIGDGPDFQRSLFNLGGQSPLVLYYLQMHGISNTLSNTRAYRINHSEICKIPPASPTYLDVIKESQMFIHNLHDDFIDFEHRCGEELAQLEEGRRKMCKKYKRMMATITKKPTEARLKTEKFLNQVASAKPRQLKSTVLKPSGATM
ncbi:protein FAM227B isoform X2 [Sceloporus undulatus]|uniref:protein FAM227B isoform X2 n=1 Tax=Sceloporus undulatus TaxID=8520 RepID=UPI001C4B2C23|nr:protein FAM227B isoform X2 [Sceloporus undulatus]